MEVAKENRAALFKADHNGWRPIHEAARSGRHKVLEYLIEEGKFCRKLDNGIYFAICVLACFGVTNLKIIIHR